MNSTTTARAGCPFCDNYDFRRVGYDFDAGPDRPTIYFPGGIGFPDEEERFKFCPICGRALTEEHFKLPMERSWNK